MPDVGLTSPQLQMLHRLREVGSLDEATFHRQEKLSLWALERRDLAHRVPGGRWVLTDKGLAWGLTANGLLDVTVQCAHCGRTLTVAAPGSHVSVACGCQPALAAPRVQTRSGTPKGRRAAQEAAKIAAGGVNEQHRIILRHYAAAGDRGITQPELERLPGVDTRAHRTRRGALYQAGLLEQTASRRRVAHAGPSGRRGANAIVYRITERGREVAASWEK